MKNMRHQIHYPVSMLTGVTVVANAVEDATTRNVLLTKFPFMIATPTQPTEAMLFSFTSHQDLATLPQSRAPVHTQTYTTTCTNG